MNFSLSNSWPAIYSVPSAPLKLFCLFDQYFPTNGVLAAQITGHTIVQQWRDALDAVQQRHPLLSARIDTTFNRVPHFRRVTGQRIPIRVVTLLNRNSWIPLYDILAEHGNDATCAQ